MTYKAILISLAAATLSACATSGAVKTSGDDGAPRTGLSARTLAAGDCGLFVWTADAERRFVLFSQSQEMSGVWDTPEGERALIIASLDGTPAQSQFPKQDFGSLKLDLRNPQAITNGTRYRAGTLTQSEAGDWLRVIPVVGLSACQP